MLRHFWREKGQSRLSKTGHINHGRQESTGGNTGLAIVTVQCSVDTFMVNQRWSASSTFVIKITTFAKPDNYGLVENFADEFEVQLAYREERNPVSIKCIP
jgi:hypothetical protein